MSNDRCGAAEYSMGEFEWRYDPSAFGNSTQKLFGRRSPPGVRQVFARGKQTAMSLADLILFSTDYGQGRD